MARDNISLYHHRQNPLLEAEAERGPPVAVGVADEGVLAARAIRGAVVVDEVVGGEAAVVVAGVRIISNREVPGLITPLRVPLGRPPVSRRI